MKRAATEEESIEVGHNTKQQKHSIGATTHASTVLGGSQSKKEEDLDKLDDEAFIAWLDDFDKLLLHKADGTDTQYGRCYYKILDNGWLEVFRGTKLSSVYYEKNPEKLEDDEVLCQDICSLPILHGIVVFLQTSPNICYGSHEMQVVCHVIKEKLVRNKRNIPAFLKRLLQIYEEYEYPERFACEDSKDCYNRHHHHHHLNNTDKHLKIMIIIFLTQNLSFLTFGPRILYGVTYPDGYLLSCESGNIKDGICLSDVILSNLSPTDTYLSFDTEMLDFVTKTYIEERLTEWRKYMYNDKVALRNFRVKPLKIQIKTAKIMKILPSY
jgi:hypothetical protein